MRLSGGFLEMHVRPLSAEEAAGFVRNWYAIVERGLATDREQAKSIAEEKADKLIKRLQSQDFRSRKILELTRNPLLLTNICLVHRHRGELPKKRARLYEECIDVLLEHWRQGKGLPAGLTTPQGRRVLQPAALWLHGREGRTKATAAELAPHLEPMLKAVDATHTNGGDFLHAVRDESGLLTGWDQERYGFMHLGFQEYLAAREIRNQGLDDPKVLRDLAGHFGESWWQEVILLLLALDEPSVFEKFMRELVNLPVFGRYRSLVDDCLEDAGEVSVRPFWELVERGMVSGNEWKWWQRFVGWRQKPPMPDGELGARQLLALQLVARIAPEIVEENLARLSKHPSRSIGAWLSNRKMAGLETIRAARGGYELVRIPGGDFLMGSPEDEKGRYEYEGPQHKVRVNDFYLGRYPVTNEEYALFLQENKEVGEPEYWSDRRFNGPRQSVIGVSWEDARRYADWAGLRLPSEAEWEYACRAGSTSRYYSGDSDYDLARVGWYSENSGGQSHPVGAKEPNAFALYDMHGNVWEWVEDDAYKTYKGAPNNGEAWVGNPRGSFRVVRGGAWDIVARDCRSAIRFNFGHGIRYDLLGFRLSRSD